MNHGGNFGESAGVYWWQIFLARFCVLLGGLICVLGRLYSCFERDRLVGFRLISSFWRGFFLGGGGVELVGGFSVCDFVVYFGRSLPR